MSNLVGLIYVKKATMLLVQRIIYIIALHMRPAINIAGGGLTNTDLPIGRCRFPEMNGLIRS
jgi:hypothetical protein